MIRARDLSVGDYVRSPKGASKIYRVKEKRSEASILCWRVDPVTGTDQSNDFIFIRGEDMVEKASI